MKIADKEMEMESKGNSIFWCLVVGLFFSLLMIHAYPDGAACPSLHKGNSSVANGTMKVGVVLDMGSWTGHTILSCIETAITDFYASNSHYKTRMILHARDSKGDPVQAISAAVDLLERVKVQAILGPETYSEAKLLALLGDKAKIPIFAFSSVLSPYGRHPFLVQIKQDEIFQFKGLAHVLRWYKWWTVNIIYEDSDYGRESLPYLIESVGEEKIHVAQNIAISGFYGDDQIVSMLNDLATKQATINIVHMSKGIAGRLFRGVKRLGMMKEGYSWILTEHTMNSLDKEMTDSLQGAIGIKAHIPESSKLKEFALRWRKGFEEKGQKKKSRDPHVSGILAYDTAWALAESFEKSEKQPWKAAERRLLNEMEGTKVAGLSGEFQISNGKIRSESYAIVNVIGKGDRVVGFWTQKHGLVKEIQVHEEFGVDAPRRGLQAVACPEGSVISPGGLPGVTSAKKLRIGLPINFGFPEFAHSYRDPLTNITRFTGYCIDIFHAAISSLDYEVPYELIPFLDRDGKQNGSYNDLIYQTYLGEFDGVVGDITILANRSLYVDFTMPYTDLGVGTIAKRSISDIWIFSRPLHANLWLISGIFFTLMGLVVWIIEHPINEEFQGSVSQQVGTLLSFGFSTLVYAHREKLRSNLSKFVVNVWLFVVLILTSSYTATLSSMLTVRQIQLASAADHMGFQIRSPIVMGVIENNLNFKDDRLQQYGSPEEYAKALSAGSKKGGVIAIVDEIPYIKIFLAKYGRDYSMVASASTSGGFGFGFRKTFPELVSNMSRAILKMRAEGTLAMLEEKWFTRKLSFIPDDDATTPSALDLNSFRGLFLIISVSIALALILLLIFSLSKWVQAYSAVNIALYGVYLAFFLRFVAPRSQNVVELAYVR